MEVWAWWGTGKGRERKHVHTYYAMRTVTWRKLMRSWVWTGCGKGVKACHQGKNEMLALSGH